MRGTRLSDRESIFEALGDDQRRRAFGRLRYRDPECRILALLHQEQLPMRRNSALAALGIEVAQLHANRLAGSRGEDPDDSTLA